MKKLFSKIIFTILMIIAILAVSNTVLGASETHTILQKSDSEYVIYLKASLNKEFDCSN